LLTRNRGDVGREGLTHALRELAGDDAQKMDRNGESWLVTVDLESLFGVNSGPCYRQVERDDITSSSRVLIK